MKDRIRYDEALKSYRNYNSCMYYAVNEASKKAQGIDPLVIAQAVKLSLEEIEKL